MRELLKDDQRLYSLLEAEDGQLVLRVVCGGIGWYERDLVLSEEQLAYYRDLGKYFLDSLALKVAKGWV